MKFAETIKDLRADSGLSQMELSKKIGISAAAIGHLELGKHEPNGATIVAYSKYFNVSAGYLLGLEDDFGAPIAAPMGASSYSSEERQLIEEYRKLPAESRKLVLRMVGISSTSQETKKKA